MIKKKTAIYIRVSVLKEVAVSPQMQLDKAESYCKLQGEEYEVYQDLDFSGKDTNRPAFQRMHRKIKAGYISKLIVYRLDRLSRSLKDLALFMDFLREKGVEFFSVTEHFDTSTPMGRAMFSIMGVFAQMEREVISERIADTKAKQMADGIKLGPAPYGYRLKVKSRSQWEIIPEEAKIIRKVFELYASGKHSYISLAAYLHRTIGRSPRKKGPGMVPWGVSGCARQGWGREREAAI
jgi:site-specific DNA recombinase